MIFFQCDEDMRRNSGRVSVKIGTTSSRELLKQIEAVVNVEYADLDLRN